MRLRIEYQLAAEGAFPVTELPLELEVDGAQVGITVAEGAQPAVTVNMHVDRTGIRVDDEAHVRDAATGLPLTSLVVDEVVIATEIARRVAYSISFITEVPLRLSRKTWYPDLIVEGDLDVALLDSLGTRLVASGLDRGSPGLGSTLPLIPQNVAFLSDRVAGVRLFADALKTGTSAGLFRELWRVFESGFGKRDKDLIALLSTCEVATDMEFTDHELNELLVLRGRASYAQSKAALSEVVAVERESSRVVNRVERLAVALILRKVNWGDQTLAVHQPPRPLPFVRRDGSVVMYTSRPE